MTTPESSENRETVGSGISGPTGHDLGVGTTPDTAESVASSASELPNERKSGEAWYHVDFCHAFAWVYEDGDKLRVRWGERSGSDLYLHGKSECDYCRTLRKERHKARDGEFTMDKPPAEFSSHESFFHVLAEIAKYVPGLIEDGDDD